MIGWAVGTTIAVAALIALVLVLRRPVARWFGARAAYALWLAPAARAVMPPLPDGIAAAAPSVTAPAEYWITTGSAAGPSALAWGDLLLAVWLGGALLFLGLQWWRHHRFLSDALASGRPLTGLGISYDVIASPDVDGPLATGLIHPLILVPIDFEQRLNADQQRLALLHEQLHHRGGDIWASAAALLLASLHWFNPLTHLALGAFRRDMEAACDARLLAATGQDAAPAYAATILHCASRPVPRSLCALTTIDELKGRLTMLNANHGNAHRFAGLFLAGGLAAAGMAMAAPAPADESTGREKVTIKTIEVHEADGKDVALRANPGDLERIGAQCPGEKFEATADGGDGDRKESVKFVICTDQGEGRAGMLKALEKAVADLAKRDEMPASVKADLTAKLRSKIESLRSGG